MIDIKAPQYFKYFQTQVFYRHDYNDNPVKHNHKLNLIRKFMLSLHNRANA